MMLARYEQAQGWDAGEFAHFSPEEARYFAAEAATLGLPERAGLRVLDIGFGNGAWMGWCRFHGMQCHGVEINDALLERARAAGFQVYGAEELPAPATPFCSSYDLITLFDVLEHIPRERLVPFLEDVVRRCSAHTLVLARFPNGDNPFSLPLQNGDVTHVTAIGRAMLRQVAMLAGMEVLALRDPAQPLAGLRVRRRLAILAGRPLRRAIGAVIRHLFMGSMPVSFAPNLVAVLRKAPATEPEA